MVDEGAAAVGPTLDLGAIEGFAPSPEGLAHGLDTGLKGAVLEIASQPRPRATPASMPHDRLLRSPPRCTSSSAGGDQQLRARPASPTTARPYRAGTRQTPTPPRSGISGTNVNTANN
jgi:hypothetical protein